ncbi:MAG: response regulator [Acidobacteria bacterium]|nr:response regulator [Acidobacteriota bacterium]
MDRIVKVWIGPMVFFALMALATLVLFVLLRQNQSIQLKTETEVTSTQVKVRVENFLSARIGLIGQMVNQFSGPTPVTAEEFAEQSETYLHWFSGLLAINWVDPDWVIQIVTPLAPNRNALGKDLHHHPSGLVIGALSKAERTGGVCATPIIELYQGGKGFAVYWPVYDANGSIKGYINGVFRVQKFIDECLNEGQLRDRFDFDIAQDQTPFYQSWQEDLPSEAPKDTRQSLPIQILDQTWTLNIWPKSPFIQSLSNRWSHWILALGLLGTLTAAFFYANTIKRQNQVALQKSLLEAQAEASLDSTLMFSRDGRLLYANQQISELAQVPELPFLTHFSAWQTWIGEKIGQWEGLSFLGNAHFQMQRKRGEFLSIHGKTLEWYLAPVLDQAGHLMGQLLGFRDMSQRRLLENQLRGQEQLLAKIFQAANEGILLIQPSGLQIVEANDQACTILGLALDKAKVQRLGDLLFGTDSEKAPLLSAIQEKESNYFDRIYFRQASGKPVPCELSSAQFSHLQKQYLILMFRDITRRVEAEKEKVRLEKQVQHTQKLESLGILAGGIAHDFNNFLATILGNADLAELAIRQSNPDQTLTSIQEIQSATQKASSLTRQLLAYSGKGKFVSEALDLNHIVAEMGTLLRVTIPKKIQITTDFQEPLPPIFGDPGQIAQVVMNLISNAADSMGDQVGQILLRTYNGNRPETPGQLVLGQHDPQRIYNFFQATDQGTGIEPQNIQKIFDPFFSTKFTGRGLGLAAVAGILKSHEGICWIQSEIGLGSTFIVGFPEYQGSLSESQPAPSEDSDMQGTILVADDEPTILEMISKALRYKGLNVILARDGQEALDKMHAKVQLVLLDVTMPVLDGFQVQSSLRNQHPTLPILLSSGYSESVQTERFADDPYTEFIQKPYKIVDLINKIQKMLGGS